MRNVSSGSRLRVVITGSKGFIGRHLTERLRPIIQDLVEWEKDVRELGKYDKSADVVFHLAAVSRYEQFLDAAHRSYEVNVAGTLAVLNYCEMVGARCVLASTSGVYRSPGDAQPISENGVIEPKLPYGTSKWLAESLCRQQSNDLGIPSVVLRLFNVYGPGQHRSFLVAEVIDCLLKKRPLVLRMPDALRDFIYVGDVVEALLRAAQLEDLGETGCKIFNVGSGKPVSVRDMVALAEKIFGSAQSIDFVESHDGEVTSAVADISRTCEELDWTPRFDLEAGLKAIKAALRQSQ